MGVKIRTLLRSRPMMSATELVSAANAHFNTPLATTHPVTRGISDSQPGLSEPIRTVPTRKHPNKQMKTSQMQWNGVQSRSHDHECARATQAVAGAVSARAVSAGDTAGDATGAAKRSTVGCALMSAFRPLTWSSFLPLSSAPLNFMNAIGIAWGRRGRRGQGREEALVIV